MHKMPTVRRWISGAVLLGLAAFGVQCTKSSSGGSGGAFDVIAFSATKQSPRVYLDDQIVVTFNANIDPQTVLSGIYIYISASAGAVIAQGQWTVNGPKATFTPRLPSTPNFGDGGLLPDTEYTICVPRTGEACGVYIQNSPGVRSTGGRSVSATRGETFLTVSLQGSNSPFRPETVPVRPEIEYMQVSDAVGVTQMLNPITNLVSGQTFSASALSLVSVTPSTMSVPEFRYAETPLTKSVTSPISATTNVVSKDPLTVTLNLSVPMIPNEYVNTGGRLTITDTSVNPPLIASWAVSGNSTNTVVAHQASGPAFDSVGFSTTAPLAAVVSQGITSQVAPGDFSASTDIVMKFSEPMMPGSVNLANFTVYRVVDAGTVLQYSAIKPAGTTQSSPRLGLENNVIDDKSVVTWRPDSGFPQSTEMDPAYIIVLMNTAQPENEVVASAKAVGLRDLNNFALAYPKRTGYVLQPDAQGAATTVGYVQPISYTNMKAAPENVEWAWGFITSASATVTNAIVETFQDRNNVATDCPQTAAWTLPGQSGLFATPGFGGNGSDGDLTVAGSLTLNSGTRTPGLNGVVAWNYNRLNIATSGQLTLTGPNPIRINGAERIEVAGQVFVDGRNGLPGPAGPAGTVGTVQGGPGGPGGGTGGDSNTMPNNPLGALPVNLRGGPGFPRSTTDCNAVNKSENFTLIVFQINCGGGTGGNRGLPSGSILRSGCTGNGGGHAKAGQQTDFACSNAGAFGSTFGDVWIIVSGATAVADVSAGAAGGAGGNAATSTSSQPPTADIVAGSGGGGGGGVEFASAGVLEVKGSATISANGGNGGVGFSTLVGNTTVRAGYGAGGAGGSIWLSGVDTQVNAGATISAVGGIGNPNASTPNRMGNGGDGYIIIRDLGGNPAIGATTTPPHVMARMQWSPPGNVVGGSSAVSSFYDSGEASPFWAFDANNPSTGLIVPGNDLVFLNPPVANQKAYIEFQGAPDNGAGLPDPDPSKWFPPGNSTQNPCAQWATDITQLRAANVMRHVRFRVRFEIGSTSKSAPPPNRIAISQVVLRYQQPVP